MYGHPVDPQPKAWLVTEYNTKLLANISPFPEKTLLANPFWVIVEDWIQHPRFLILPFKEFRRAYPDLNMHIHGNDPDLS
jgi:hypothetical protein